MNPASLAAGISPVSAAVSAAPELYQLIMGIHQRNLAKKLERQPRPQYNIPSYITEALGLARNAARDPNLPGQQLMEDRIGAQTAASVQQAQQLGVGANSILGAMSAAQGAENKALTDLQIAAAEQQQADNLSLQSALERAAPYQDKVFDTNVMEPYKAAMAASSALKEGGMHNIYGGIRGIGAAANAINSATDMIPPEIPNRISKAGPMEQGIASNAFRSLRKTMNQVPGMYGVTDNTPVQQAPVLGMNAPSSFTINPPNVPMPPSPKKQDQEEMDIYGFLMNQSRRGKGYGF